MGRDLAALLAEAEQCRVLNPHHPAALLADALRGLLYEPPRGPGVSPIVVCRTKEGHTLHVALLAAEERELDAVARAMRAEAEIERLRVLLAEGVDLTKDTPFGDSGDDWWDRAYDASRGTPVHVSSTVEPEATTQPAGPTVDTRTVGE